MYILTYFVESILIVLSLNTKYYQFMSYSVSWRLIAISLIGKNDLIIIEHQNTTRLIFHVVITKRVQQIYPFDKSHEIIVKHVKKTDF